MTSWYDLLPTFAYAGKRFGAMNDDGLFVFRMLENDGCYMVFRDSSGKLVESCFMQEADTFRFRNRSYSRTPEGVLVLVRDMAEAIE